MITNHFVEPFYHFAAKEKLGLEFFSQNEILEASFLSDIEEGDIYLQYRRPGRDLVASRWASSRYPDRDLQHLPPFTYIEDLLHPKIGTMCNARRARAAIRFMRVVNVFDYRRHSYTWKGLECESWYSRPNAWGVRPYGNCTGIIGISREAFKWKDVRNPGYYNRRNGTIPTKTIYLREGYAHGIVAKVTKEDFLSTYFELEGYDRGQVKDRDLYAYVRALLGDNHLTKRTADILVGGENHPSQLPIKEV